MEVIGDTQEEIRSHIQEWIEAPHMIALPGGTWCWFCKKEICRNPRKHCHPITLQIAMNKLIRDLEEARKKALH